MTSPPFLILPESEWNRLQRQGGPAPEEPTNVKSEYLKALTEQSRTWAKTWPDTVAGHLAKLENEKKNKNQHKANIEFIKSFKKAADEAEQESTAAAIKHARQLIFENSNYGRKLLSALLESRAIDERDAQIKFSKELQQKAVELAKERVITKGGIDFYDKDEENEKEKKIKTLDCIRANEEIVLLKKEKELEEKLIEKQCAIDEKKLMKQVIEIEKKEKEDIKRCERKQLEEYKADTKKLAIIKEHDEKLSDALIEANKREQDMIKVKTRAVLKKVHQGRPDTKWSKDMYDNIEQIQIRDKKYYEDFVEKGIKAQEQKDITKDAMDILQEKQKSSDRFLISQMNKIAGEERALIKKYENKCICDRQSLIMNLTGNPKETKKSDQSSKNAEKKSGMIYNGKSSFLASRNKLREELRKREKEPSPWNAARGVHEQFARQADNILKEVKHKHFARKVVDEYRGFNCLDATTLPVPNY